MNTTAEVWKGLSGMDRRVIVERLFALSSGVLEWKRRCASGDLASWVLCGRLDFTIYAIRKEVGEALGKALQGAELAEIDGAWKVVRRAEQEAMLASLDDVAMLFEEWAEACAGGKAVAWIVFGRLAEYVEQLWDEIGQEGRDDGLHR